MELIRHFLPCLYAFFACIGFSVLFNIQGTGILICSAGGALGWLVYLITEPLCGGSELIQALAAAVALAAYGEIMARVRRCLVTPYILVAALPLVPGAGIYYCMEHAINGETQAFLNRFLHTLGLAGAMAVGILLVGSVTRLAAGRHRKPSQERM